MVDEGCLTKIQLLSAQSMACQQGQQFTFQCLKARVPVTKLIVSHEAFGVKYRNWKRLTGEQREQKGPIVPEKQSLTFMTIAVTGKAAERCRTLCETLFRDRK